MFYQIKAVNTVMGATNLVDGPIFGKIFFVAYILLYLIYKLFFKFEIICMLHCQVMEDSTLAKL